MPKRSVADEIEKLAQTPNDDVLPQFGTEASEDFEVEFDFSDDGGIEDGIYHARVSDFVLSTSKKGNSMYVWDFTLLEVNRTIQSYTALTPAARWKVTEHLNGVGIQGNPDQPIAKFKRSDILGRPCRIEIVNEQDNRPTAPQGRMVPRIAQVLPPDQQSLILNDLP